MTLSASCSYYPIRGFLIGREKYQNIEFRMKE